MSKFLLSLCMSALIASVPAYWLGTIKNEKATNRPFSDTLIWNLLPNGKAHLDPCDKKMLFKAILINYMITDHVEPISEEFKKQAIASLLDNTTETERSQLFNQIFRNVNKINKERGTFLSNDGLVSLIVPWGSSRIDKNYDGDECGVYLDKLRSEFLEYLHDMGTDNISEP